MTNPPFEQVIPENEQWDVFVCHDSADNWLVEPIVDILRQNGLRVFFDLDMLPGQPWVRRIEQALRASPLTLTFYTPNGLDSDWVRAEMEIAVPQAVTDPTRHVIPLLFQGVTSGQLPPLTQRFQAHDESQARVNDPPVRRQIGERLVNIISQKAPDLGLPKLYMPFVVFAMNKQEARGLLLGDDVRNRMAAREREKLDHLIEELKAKNHPAEQLVDFYADERDQWRPPLYQSSGGVSPTIRDTIEEVLNRINQPVIKRKTGGYILRPEYFSTAFTSEEVTPRNVMKRLETYKELDRRGCVLILDSLTLFHPDLGPILIESGLAQPESKTVPIVAPLPYYRPIDPIDALIEEAMDMMMKRPFNRFNTELDILCEFGVGHPRALKRWLFSVLPMVAKEIHSQRPRADTLGFFRDQVK